ncbi:MAG: MBL fold metallo-hydrolase [Acidimicrobiales bacterium]
MATTVTITGTGIPPAEPGRAGAGTLVRFAGDDGTTVALQFDAGRATSLRLAEAGQRVADLDAVFITHHHSDHVSGAPDLVFCAWVNRPVSTNLDFVAPTGPSTRFLERMLDPYDEDLAIRVAHTDRELPVPRIHGFTATEEPVEVWARGGVRVLARAVHHHPVDPAVAYRVETPDGVVVISGDTRVCDEVEDFSTGADVLVHEVLRIEEFVARSGDERARVIGDYHADSVALGAMTARAEPAVLMLTHMTPSPRSSIERDAFVDDIRAGGYEGVVMVCDDLDSHDF